MVNGSNNISKLRVELARIAASVRPLPGAKKHLERLAAMDAKLNAAQKKVSEVQRRIQEENHRDKNLKS